MSIFPKTAFAYVGQRLQFIADVQSFGTSNALPVFWSSQNNAVAIVDQQGLCTIKSKGGTAIIASARTNQGTVVAQDTAFLVCEQVVLQIFPKELRLSSDQTYQLSVSFTPFPIRWTTSNPSVAFADPSGIVHVTGMGFTKIAAEVQDPSGSLLARDSCNVFVEWWKILSLSKEISAISVSAETNSILVGTQGGLGIIASSDGGITWNPRNNGISISSSLVIRGFARFRPYPNIAMVLANGVFTTQDGGNNWNPTAISGDSIVSVAIHPTQSQIAFAIKEYNTLYKTTEGGASWILMPSPPAIVGLVPNIFINPINPANMYIGGHGSYRSTDAGATWILISWLGQGPENAVVHVDNNGSAYLQDYNWDGNLRLRLMRSTDQGSSWMQLKAFTLDGYPFTYGSDDLMPTTIFIGSSNSVSISSNSGQTWSEISSPSIASGSSHGIVLMNSSPTELIHAIGRDVWKYRKATP